jgi:hypothetical protein
LKIFRDLYQYTISQLIKCASKRRTGNSSVQVSPKIIFAKRIKQMRIVWYDIRIFFVNAIGIHVRPVLMLPKVHFKNDILSGESTGKIGGANPTGW